MVPRTRQSMFQNVAGTVSYRLRSVMPVWCLLNLQRETSRRQWDPWSRQLDLGAICGTVQVAEA